MKRALRTTLLLVQRCAGAAYHDPEGRRWQERRMAGAGHEQYTK